MNRRAALSTLLGCPLTQGANAAPWALQRKGTNCFNRHVSDEWIGAALEAKIRTVRLSYEKWGGRDYLIGSADDYRHLTSAHLKELLRILNRFDQAGIRAVLVPLTLPGARWRQMNGNRRDGRIWREKSFWDQSQKFWKDLATALKGHPAIAGLDLYNEPAPEVELGLAGLWSGKHAQWYEKVRGTAGDLNLFHRHLVEGVRSVDSSVPLIVESGLYGTPWALPETEVLADERVLYSVHMYEPYEYTTWRKHQGRLSYPGIVQLEENQEKIATGAAWLNRFFDPVRNWMKRNQLGPERLLIGEFGCGRRCPGAAEYLSDLIDIFQRERWHWLFYSFREDSWEAMDYELGTAPPPQWYWAFSDKGGLEKRYVELYASRKTNKVWQAIARRL